MSAAPPGWKQPPEGGHWYHPLVRNEDDSLLSCTKAQAWIFHRVMVATRERIAVAFDDAKAEAAKDISTPFWSREAERVARIVRRGGYPE